MEIEIGDTVTQGGGVQWVVMGTIYYEDSLWYVCVNAHGQERDLSAKSCTKVIQ
jgi:hypothetical protein